MKIIKLNAIDSTNDYLKKIVREKELENFTVVVAKYQTKGKGQFYNHWHSEKDKNLLFSILVKCSDLKIENQRYLNLAISIAVFNVLNELLEHIKIKWPNDIMSHHKKICGILIENTVKNDKIIQSIVGIGLNVNQVKFPEALKKATSLKKELDKDFDLDILLTEIINSIVIEIKKIEINNFEELYKIYIKNLYKYNIPNMFKTKDEVTFLGKIIGVTKKGKLQIEFDDETIKEFNVKEVIFLN